MGFLEPRQHLKLVCLPIPPHPLIHRDADTILAQEIALASDHGHIAVPHRGECPKQESNLHAFRHLILSQACLPIPTIGALLV